MQTFTFFSDPGHGWAQVPRTMLTDLGITAKITPYSYQRGEQVYLEEDCDLATFYNAYVAKHGQPPKFQESSSDRSSRIRSYASYRSA